MAKEQTDRTTIDLFANERRPGRPKTNPLSRDEQLRINKRNQLKRDKVRGLKRVELKLNNDAVDALNELATAVSNQTPVVVFIMNNGVLGMVRQWQTLFFDKHYSNTTLERKTDFVKLAEAFGLPGFRAASLPELKEVLKQAFAVQGPVLVDCAIDCDAFVLPMLPPGGAVEDIITDVSAL